jgi:hypothetical protein
MNTGALLQQDLKAIGELPCSATARATEDWNWGFGYEDSLLRRVSWESVPGKLIVYYHFRRKRVFGTERLHMHLHLRAESYAKHLVWSISSRRK